MQKVLFNVVNRPSNDKVGITQVVNQVTGKDGATTDTLIGQLVKTRKEGYEAQVVDTTSATGFTTVGTGFTSRSAAGHAVQHAFYADVRAQKAADRTQRRANAEARKAARELKKQNADTAPAADGTATA